jgi:tRNA(Ser,Leu) C12 N-acetylase TAN1
MISDMARTSPSAILVRFDPARPEEARAEIRRILTQVGEPDAIIKSCSVQGHLKVITEGDPHEAQTAIASLVASNPEVFRYTSHWVVADRFVTSDLESIRHAVAEYQHSIASTDTWRVAVRPHGAPLGSKQVIDAVAPLISNNHVDLEDPAKEIRIEMLGDETAVGMMDRSERIR